MGRMALTESYFYFKLSTEEESCSYFSQTFIADNIIPIYGIAWSNIEIIRLEMQGVKREILQPKVIKKAFKVVTVICKNFFCLKFCPVIVNEAAKRDEKVNIINWLNKFVEKSFGAPPLQPSRRSMSSFWFNTDAAPVMTLAYNAVDELNQLDSDIPSLLRSSFPHLHLHMFVRSQNRYGIFSLLGADKLDKYEKAIRQFTTIGHSAGYFSQLHVLDISSIFPPENYLRRAFQDLLHLCTPSKYRSYKNRIHEWFSLLQKQDWLLLVCKTLSTVRDILGFVSLDSAQCVLLFETNDYRLWTIVVSILVQLCAFPVCRTIKGFTKLILKEYVKINNVKQVNDAWCQRVEPFFRLLLDCIFQLKCQFPFSFEFSEMFLISLMDIFFSRSSFSLNSFNALSHENELLHWFNAVLLKPEFFKFSVDPLYVESDDNLVDEANFANSLLPLMVFHSFTEFWSSAYLRFCHWTEVQGGPLNDFFVFLVWKNKAENVNSLKNQLCRVFPTFKPHKSQLQETCL